MTTAATHKVCLLGDFGVGKTSLVARFVRNTFSEKYLTTVGVKVDTRELAVAGKPVKLVVWDIAGRSSLDTLDRNYLRGATGILLVCDGTRESTFRSALYLQMESRSVLGEVPAVLMINKLDLAERWEVTPVMAAEMRKTLPVFETSALTGDGVEAAFAALAGAIVK